MMKPRFVLLFLMIHLPSKVYSMTCPGPLGIDFNCPTMFNDNDKAFCCQSSGNIAYCCDFGEYIQNNSAILAGILVAALILLILITLCCCCFCSCCFLAKRRVQQGRVLYDPVASQAIPPPVYSPSPYPLQPAMIVHAPPIEHFISPGAAQLPLNPNFKG